MEMEVMFTQKTFGGQEEADKSTAAVYNTGLLVNLP